MHDNSRYFPEIAASFLVAVISHPSHILDKRRHIYDPRRGQKNQYGKPRLKNINTPIESNKNRYLFLLISGINRTFKGTETNDVSVITELVITAGVQSII